MKKRGRPPIAKFIDCAVHMDFECGGRYPLSAEDEVRMRADRNTKTKHKRRRAWQREKHGFATHVMQKKKARSAPAHFKSSSSCGPKKSTGLRDVISSAERFLASGEKDNDSFMLAMNDYEGQGLHAPGDAA